MKKIKKIKKIKCPYCTDKDYYQEHVFEQHMMIHHPEKDFNDIKLSIKSWKQLGVYEELLVDKEDGDM